MRLFYIDPETGAMRSEIEVLESEVQVYLAHPSNKYVAVAPPVCAGGYEPRLVDGAWECFPLVG
jgi:hypothetical protein